MDSYHPNSLFSGDSFFQEPQYEVPPIVHGQTSCQILIPGAKAKFRHDPKTGQQSLENERNSFALPELGNALRDYWEFHHLGELGCEARRRVGK